jgi:outer membrane murein-binding lipoprotein Lpp
MKFKDYFSTLKEQGKINNEAYNKFLESVPDADMPDDVFKVLDTTFLTSERALNHKDVAGKIRAEVLDVVDKDIKKMLTLLPAEKVLDIERESNTYKKLEMVREAIPEALAKAAKAPNDEEAKKKLNEAQTAVQELTEKFNRLNLEKEETKKALQADYEGKIKGFQINSELEKMSNSYTLADAHKETRGILTKALLGEIKAKNKLDLVEINGEAVIQVLDDHGKPRFENDGNTPVTIKSLLDTHFKPLLKVSNADDSNGQQRQQESNKQQSFKVQDGKTAPRQGANVSVTV